MFIKLGELQQIEGIVDSESAIPLVSEEVLERFRLAVTLDVGVTGISEFRVNVTLIDVIPTLSLAGIEIEIVPFS